MATRARTSGKYEAGDRVEFVSHGAMFGRVGTVKFVRPDGHLIVHFDGDPEGSARFADLTDVRLVAGAVGPARAQGARMQVKLTGSQAKNLAILRAAGGVVLAKGSDWVAPGSNRPIRGLNGKTIRNLAQAGLVRGFHGDGSPASWHVRPARIEVVEGAAEAGPAPTSAPTPAEIERDVLAVVRGDRR